MIPQQAVILCGGYGTRLGSLTANTPKPLLMVGDTPFLRILIEELVRQDIKEILLLAAFEAEQIEEFAKSLRGQLAKPVDLKVIREEKPAGTAGALAQAASEIANRFFLLNGDSWFDILIADVARIEQQDSHALGGLALRKVQNGERYGTVKLTGEHIVDFCERGQNSGPALINGGVYCFNKAILDHLPYEGSLEADVLPGLAREGKLVGVERTGFFLDIGIPTDYEMAQDLVPQRRCRPAVIFDRDGVLNKDLGHVGTKDRLEWIEGAREAIRLVNEAGWFAFVATNQAGIAKGYYSLEDYYALRAYMHNAISEKGGHIDAEKFCPMHPDGIIAEYRGQSNRRKPNPGMLLELKDEWPIDWERSFMIGDKKTDIQAASSAGLSGILVEDGNTLKTVKDLLKNHGDDESQR